MAATTSGPTMSGISEVEQRKIWVAWLPPELRTQVEQEEPQRFSALVNCVVTEVALAQDSTDPNRWHRLIQFVPLINSFTDLRMDRPGQELVLLASALWEVVLATAHDLEVQVRVADCLTSLLRAHKRQLSHEGLLALRWQPLYELLASLFSSPTPRLEGLGLTGTRQSSLLKLAAKARRFFPPEAAGEVWACLRGAVTAVAVRPADAFEAANWLALLTPTHSITKGDWSAANALLLQWMDAWGRLVCSPQWDSLWLGLMARAAKHDYKGMLLWEPHVPRLFCAFMGAFDVPVGTSTSAGASAVSRGVPLKAFMMFHGQLSAASLQAARLIVSLLRICPERPATASCSACALGHFEHMVTLLEQYYHPSNTGKWCRDLATLLKHLVKQAAKQLQRQHGSGEPAGGDGGSDTEDDDGGGGGGGGVAGDIDGDRDDDVLDALGGGAPGVGVVGAAGGPGAIKPWISSLQPEALQRLAVACCKLAARAQFSKDHILAQVSVKALSQLAVMAPDVALPLVVQRFRDALQTATATHQLAAAISAMAMCVRPLLLSGWAPSLPGAAAAPLSPAAEEERGSVPQLLSEALVAALPGIDANDEAKTSAVLLLYTSVLTALPRLRGAAGSEDDEQELAPLEPPEGPVPMDVGPGAAGAGGVGGVGMAVREGVRLPLYVEEWGVEVVERLLALLANLDSGLSHRSTDAAAAGAGRSAAQATSSFLMSGHSLFAPLCGLLFQKLPPRLAERLVGQLARFVLGSSLPGVASELGVMVGQAASYLPQATERLLLLPLLAKLEAEVADLPAGAHHPPPTAGQESALRYQLALLQDTCGQLHASRLLALAPRLLALSERLLALNSRPLALEGGALPGLLASCMGRFWIEPALPWRAGGEGAVALVGCGVELGVDKFGTGYAPPRWCSPSPEQLAFAQQLVAERLVAPAERLAALAARGDVSSPGAKLELHAELARVHGMLVWTSSLLHDFQWGTTAATPATDAVPTPLHVVGASGVQLGAPGVRERVAAALRPACGALWSADPELLRLAAKGSALLLANGSAEYVSAVASHRVQRHMTHLLADAPMMARLLGDGVAWRRRFPQWAVVMRLLNTLMWRTSSAAFRSWATSAAPEMPSHEAVPVAYRELLQSLVDLSLHSNKALRSEALGSVDTALKRLPVLAPCYAHHYLAALAGLNQQQLAAALGDAAAAPAPPPEAFFTLLEQRAMANAGGDAPEVAAAGAGGAAAAESESERDGRVLGACSVLAHALNFWRLIFRQPVYLAATLHALMASRTHNASVPQAGIAQLLVTMCGRFVHPPALRYDSPLYSSLAAQLAALGRPGGLRGTTFRYSLVANVLLLLLLPPADSPAALAHARHLVALLAAGQGSEQQLRLLGGSGLFVLMSGMVEHRQANPELAALLRQAIGEAPAAAVAADVQMAAAEGVQVAAGGGGGGNGNGGASWGARLFHALHHDHQQLDNAEAMKDKRGSALLSMQARLLNMTFEELISKVVFGALDRLARWPHHDPSTPAALAEGSFVVNHAKLVQLLAVLAPQEVVATLRPELTARLAAAADRQAGSGGSSGTPSDKSEVAATAEILSGLVASGAPWAGGADGSWAVALMATGLRTCSLEMADSWAVALRYSVKGMLDALLPEARFGGVPAVAEAGKVAAVLQPAVVPGLSRDTLGAALESLLVLALQPGGGDAAAGVTAAAGSVAEAPAPAAAAGGGLGSNMKRLRFVGQLLRELVTLEPSREVPLQVRSWWGRLLGEVSELVSGPDSFSLREALAQPLVEVLGYFGANGGRPSAGGHGNGAGVPQGASAGGSVEGEVVLVRSGGVAGSNGGNGASGMSTPVAVEMEEPGSGSEPIVLLLHSSMAALQQQAQQLAEGLVSSFLESSQAVQALRPAQAGAAAAAPAAAAASTGGASAASGASSPSKASDISDVVMVTHADVAGASATASVGAAKASPQPAPMEVEEAGSNGSGAAADALLQQHLALLGVGLQALQAAATRGSVVRLRDMMVAMLPGLLQLQELAGPLLQRLSREAQLAFALVKSLPLAGRQQVVTALAAACSAAGADAWSTRAAALLFCQTLWFRHNPYMAPADLARLQEMVLGRLPDAKAEVRSLAAATLSGLLKGAALADVQALRVRLVDQARRLFGNGGGRRRRGDAAGAAAAPAAQPLPPAPTSLERHGCVQGLQALLLSSPYDTPAWLVGVLLALVPAAGASERDAGVRGEAAKALGEFRRTHEAEALDELRAQMSEEQWDSFAQVTSAATYFV